MLPHRKAFGNHILTRECSTGPPLNTSYLFIVKAVQGGAANVSHAPRQRRNRRLLQKAAPSEDRLVELEYLVPEVKEASQPQEFEFPASSVHAPGQVVGDGYEIREILGRGSNAVTYRAITKDGREVALKAMSLKQMRDWKQFELFQREAQIMESLNHPGIPKYLDYFEIDSPEDRYFYIAQEIAKGLTLADMIKSGGRCSESEVLRIARELLGILKYLGSLRPPVIHRDVKPENVVLEGGTWGGRVILVDFGGVQGTAQVGSNVTLGSTIVGTYGYMAPEQFRGSAQPASDLYALGGTLLYCLSGQPPFAFPQERMRINWRGKVSVGPVLDRLLQGLLEPILEDRITSDEGLAILEGRGAARRTLPTEEPDKGSNIRGGWVRSRKAGGVEGNAPVFIRLPDGSVMKLPGNRQEYRPTAAPQKAPSRPVGTRVKLEKGPTRLEIEVPPEGFTGSSLSTGLFAVVWNAFVAFWTFSALASGGVLFALFSAPFWFAGVQLAQQALGPSLLKEHIIIGRNKFRISQELATINGGLPKFLGGANRRQKEGETCNLRGARVVTTVIVNGVPRTALEVVEGLNRYRLGEGLQRLEQEWLAGEINQLLAEQRGGSLDPDSWPAAEEPKRVDDRDSDTSPGDSEFDRWFDPEKRR